jgi:hypothetical protein
MAADGGLLEAATRLTQAEHPAAYMAAFEDVRDAVENATSRPAPPRPAAEGADIRLITIEKQRVALDLLNAYLEIGHPHDELSRSLVAEARRWTSRPDGGPPFAALEVDDGWAIAALNAHEARRQSERADVSESLLKKVRANITTVMAGVESIDDIDALLGMVTPEEEALIASLDAEDAIATPHREWCADLSEFQGTRCECDARPAPPTAAEQAALDRLEADLPDEEFIHGPEFMADVRMVLALARRAGGEWTAAKPRPAGTGPLPAAATPDDPYEGVKEQARRNREAYVKGYEAGRAATTPRDHAGEGGR